jgi:hypothetical protein
MSFGPIRMPERVLNPSSRHRRAAARLVRGPSALDGRSSHSHPNALLHLRASDWTAPESTGVASVPEARGWHLPLKRRRPTCRPCPGGPSHSIRGGTTV